MVVPDGKSRLFELLRGARRISSGVKEFFRNDGDLDAHGVPAKEDGFARSADSCPALPSRHIRKRPPSTSFSSAPRELPSSNETASGSARSMSKGCWPSRGVAPPHSVGISISAPAAGLGPPSPTTAAGTASARSVKPLPVKGGSQHVKENFSRRASSMWSSHYPTGSRPGSFSTHNNRPQ